MRCFFFFFFFLTLFLEERGGNPTPAKVASVTFKSYAAIHAKYWRSKSLLSYPWLRGANWTSGEGKESFEQAQKMARDMWEKSKDKPAFSFHPLVKDALEKALAGQSWEAQTARLNGTQKNACFCAVVSQSKMNQLAPIGLWCMEIAGQETPCGILKDLSRFENLFFES